MITRATPLHERFFSRVDKQPSGCWIWTGAKSPQGYGNLSVRGVQTSAHRFAYTYLVGPIPEGLTLDHLCRNPSCVNPDHLEPVTMEENHRRALVARNGGTLLAPLCCRGHAYTPENTYTFKRGSRTFRRCRACTQIRAGVRNPRRPYGPQRNRQRATATPPAADAGEPAGQLQDAA